MWARAHTTHLVDLICNDHEVVVLGKLDELLLVVLLNDLPGWVAGGDHREAAGNKPLLLSLQPTNCAVSEWCDRCQQACGEEEAWHPPAHFFPCRPLTWPERL